MKKELEHLKKEMEEYIQDSETKSLKETLSNPLEEVHIPCDLKTIDIYNPFSMETSINEDIYSYLEDAYEMNKISLKLKIDFSFPEDTKEEEKDKIINLMRIHYARAAKRQGAEVTKSILLSLILLCIGSIFLTASFIVEYVFEQKLVFEILNIFAWVFIWECCHEFFFTISKTKTQRIKTLRLFDAIK